MKVVMARAMGLCFGVRAALDTAFSCADAGEITISGELVHNEQVLARLRRRGFTMIPEGEQGPACKTKKVMITAHGISRKKRAALEGVGHRLIDTTCPLVTRVHEEASRMEREGYHVIVIGAPGHVEVRGITEDLASSHVVATPSDVEAYGHSRLGVVCQTTTVLTRATEILMAIRLRNPGAEVHFVNTVCEPTRLRIAAVQELAAEVDIMVVVGGRNSNNTAQLARLCREQGCPVFHVQRAQDLHPRWFESCQVVGLTAGTSTTDEVVREVQRALRWSLD